MSTLKCSIQKIFSKKHWGNHCKSANQRRWWQEKSREVTVCSGCFASEVMDFDSGLHKRCESGLHKRYDSGITQIP